RRLIEGDDAIVLHVVFGVQVEHIFHPVDELGTNRRDAPFLLQPGLEIVFLSVRRTVSSEIESTTPRETSLSAKRCMVQTFWSSGGVEQAQAMRVASPLPSSLDGPPGRGCSPSAPSRLPSTKRLRMRSTVAVPTCKAAAIAASVAPASAWSKICARLSLR